MLTLAALQLLWTHAQKEPELLNFPLSSMVFVASISSNNNNTASPPHQSLQMPITYSNSHSPYDNDANNVNDTNYSTGEGGYNLNNDIYGGVANYELDDFAGVDNTPPTLDDYPLYSQAYNTTASHQNHTSSTNMESSSVGRSNSLSDQRYEIPKAASVSKQEPGSMGIKKSASAEQLPAEQVAAASTFVTPQSSRTIELSGHHLSSPGIYKKNPGFRQQMKFWAPCLTGFPIITKDSFTRGKPNIVYYGLILLIGLFMLGIFGMDLYFFVQYAVLNAFRPAADDPPFKWVSVGANARGFLAIGARSHGVISIGQFAMGGIVIGQLGIGVVTIAQCGIGLLFSAGMVSSSLVWASGMISMAFYTKFTLLAVAMWNTNVTLFGLRSLSCFFEWRYLLREDAEEYKQKPKMDSQGQPFVLILCAGR